jgi:CRP-like cAMP-binding protein
MLTYKILRDHPQEFLTLTGVTTDQFDELLIQVTTIWDSSERQRLSGPNRQRAIGAGRNYALNLSDRLVMTLMWGHLSLNTEAVGALFEVNKSTVSRNLRRMRAALAQLEPTTVGAKIPKRGRGKTLEQTLREYPDLTQILAKAAHASSLDHEEEKPDGSPRRFIARTPPFQELPPKALDEVISAGRVVHKERHAFFYHQQDPATHFYILMNGQVRLSEVTADGHHILVRFVSPGEALGIIAVLKNSDYPLAAQAVEDCRAWAWDSETLKQLMERFPNIAISGMRLVSDRWHELEERYRELATEQVERRLARTLLRLVRPVGRRVDNGILIDLALTRQDMADMTGATQYTVSRIISRWEHDHLIKSGRGWILIRDPHGLTRIAEDIPSPDSAG